MYEEQGTFESDCQSYMYVAGLKTRLDRAYKFASSFVHDKQVKQKQKFDHFVKGATLSVDDRVLIKQMFLLDLIKLQIYVLIMFFRFCPNPSRISQCA